MPDDKKVKKDSIVTNPNGSFTIYGVTYADPVQDVDPDQLSFSEMFSSTRRNNPDQKTFKWRGKEYSTKVKEFGGPVQGTGGWSNKAVPGMIKGRHK